MKILFAKTNSPYFNLATEEYLFNSEKYQPPIVFLWQNQNTIVVGKNQNTFAEINLINAQKDAVNIVRRNTGGGTVYQDLGNLCFSLLISNQNESSTEVFEKSLQPILDLLRSLGLNANFKGRNDLEIDGAKISGNAQVKNSTKILSHGTLLFDVDLPKLGKYLNVNQVKMESKKIASAPARVTNIKPLLKDNLGIENFIKMIAKQYSQANVEEFILDAEDLKAIEELETNKFKTWEWNFGKNETFSSVKTEYIPQIGLIEIGMNVDKGIIKSMHIFGDFLGTLGTQGITEKLIEKKYDRETIKNELTKIKNINEIFGADIDIENLVNLILK
ncbi:lipoate protein ligase A [Williamsoniiplasma luminosum]|uniref:lipoate--protein ligase n=1 Tax=Williamsoniiplasma luminosum TaxID=214888 RepID=A0A2K8NU90_9MOLU|nr:lipoate--protein ligase [Williamsoniiplasma luminosum]ATZ16738.1 lipoate protein ligase A [Williamsoniiplasma luminosum]